MTATDSRPALPPVAAPPPPAPATAAPTAPATAPRAAAPDIDPEPASTLQRVLVAVFVGLPMLALVAAIPVAWGWGLGWHDVVIAVAFYLFSGLGISMGFHRYFTHGSFKAVRGFKILLAIAGSSAHRGTGDHLGLRPPAAPQVQRPRRRPALAVAVRRRLEGPDQGPGLRAHGLAVRRREDLGRRSSARTGSRTATS